HFEAETDRICNLFCMLGIHNQGVAQLAGSTRELAEDKDALLVIACSQKLFCHQVHPVVQRGNHAEICRAIVPLNLFVAVLPLKKNDWPPLTALETPIDSVRFSLHLSQ